MEKEGKAKKILVVDDKEDSRALVAKLEKSEAEFRYLSSVLGAIRNINQLVVQERDRTKLLKDACKILLKVREYRFVWIGLIEEGNKRVIPVARAGVEDSYLDAVEITWDDSQSGRGPTGTAIKTRKPDMIRNIPKNPRAASWREEALRRGYRSSAAIPLIHGDKVYGALNVYSSQPDGFSDAEVELLVEVSGDLGFALKAIEGQEARQRAEEELRESEAFQSGLLSNSPIPICVVNPDSSVRFVNPALVKLTGFSAEELTGEKAPYSYWAEESPTKTMKGFKKAMRYGGDRMLELFKRKNGERFWVEITSVPVRKDGKLQYLLTHWVDITERKRAEEALADEATRRRILIDQSSDGIAILDEKGKIHEANQRFAEMLGYTPEEARELHVWDFEAQLNREQILERLRTMDESGNHFETRHRRKDGTVFDVEISSNGAVYAGQKLIFSVCRDITARKQAEEKLRESEQYLKTLFDATAGGILVIDPEMHKIIDANPAISQMIGVPRDQIIGHVCHHFVCPAEVGKCPITDLKQRLDTSERVMLNAKGEKIAILKSVVPIMRQGRQYLLELAVDITEHKQAEEALRESEARYRAVIESAHDMIQSIGLNGRIIFVNKSWLDTLGYTEAELSGLNLFDIIHPDSLEHCQKLFAEVISGKSVQGIEATFLTKDGRKILVEGNAAPRYIGSRVVASQGVFRDVTERKLAEEALIDEATRHRILIDESSDGIVILDESGKVFEANRRFAEMLGYTPEEARELSVWDWEFQYPREQVVDMIANIGPEGDHFETRHRRKDGTVLDVEISTNGAVYAGQKLIFCVCRDITARKQAEAALKESEEKYKTLVEATSDIIWEVDEKGTYTFVSPRIKDVLGYEVDEVVGKKRTLDLIAKGEFRRLLKRFKEINAKREPFFGLEIPHLHKNGSLVICEVSGIPLLDSAGNCKGYVGIDRDITESRQMQEQLVIADRLASVGELAAGIAHELNNPLTGVIGFSQMLMDREMPEDVRQDMQVVYSEAQRASQVVKNLLTFARKHTAVKEKVNINDVINKVLELRAYEQNLENITVDARPDPELPEIMADYFQLQQVFLNIIINAEYFMKETNHKGNLTITTEKVGNKIKASFADDGPGIAEDALGHLFDPFFTTKEVGRGTGLGLSICHGIIAGHGGRIYVESEPGKGATFIVELPLGAAGKKGGAA